MSLLGSLERKGPGDVLLVFIIIILVARREVKVLIHRAVIITITTE